MPYYIEPFTFNFDTSLIQIDSGVTDVDCSVLYDAVKLAQMSEEGIIYDRIAKGTGLDQLGPGVQVGLTVELLGTWQLGFAAGNYIARVAGGNLIGGPSGDPIAYSAGVQALLIQSANATVVTTSGGGGGASAADIWSYSTRTLSSGGTNSIATAVRNSLTTELDRIDVPISTRLATTTYVTPPTSSQIRQEIDTNSTKLDVAVSTRLPISSYISPDNTSIAAIKLKTDNLPSSPAATGDIPTTTQIATQVRTELSTELARIDANITTRLPISGYVAPDNISISAIKTKTDNLPSDPAKESTTQKAVDAAKLAVAVSA
jgi:hypothetical protein